MMQNARMRSGGEEAQSDRGKALENVCCSACSLGIRHGLKVISHARLPWLRDDPCWSTVSKIDEQRSIGLHDWYNSFDRQLTVTQKIWAL